MRYLTNTRPSDEELRKVRLASERSGQKVGIMFEPMPPFSDPEDFYFNNLYDYAKAKELGYWCIVGYDDTNDYSQFWKEYRNV